MENKKRHVIAKLRKLLGMKQSAFADLVECSAATIQSIEVLRLSLSEELAKRIAQETGAEIGWLLKNDWTVEPITSSGRAYTRENFEKIQAKLRAPKIKPVDFMFAQARYLSFIKRMGDLLLATHESDEIGLACYKLDIALEAIEKAFDLQWNSKTIQRKSDVQDVPEEILEAMRFGMEKCVLSLLNSFNASLFVQFRKKAPSTKTGKNIQIQCFGPRIFVSEPSKTVNAESWD